MSECSSAPFDVDRRFADRMRAIRAQAGWSQQDLALAMRDRSGAPWHQSTVAKVEAGTRPPKLSEAAAVARVFSVDLHVLVDEAEPNVRNVAANMVAEHAMQRAKQLRTELERLLDASQRAGQETANE